jgi:nicotinamide mononucleotide transporter
VSVFQTAYDAHLTISGHDITWREIIGNAFGFASAIGGLRRRVWAWPVGIVGNVLLFTVFIGTAVNGQTVPLLGQAGRQVFFVIVSVYGWQRWNQTRHHSADADAPAVRPRWATSSERMSYLATAVAGVLVLFWVFQQIGTVWPAPTWYFLADSWIFVGVPELIHFKLYPSALLYGVYLLLVLYGFFTWRRIARRELLADPTAEMVGL